MHLSHVVNCFLALTIFPPFDLCLSFVMRLEDSTYSTVLVLCFVLASTVSKSINLVGRDAPLQEAKLICNKIAHLTSHFV